MVPPSTGANAQGDSVMVKEYVSEKCRILLIIRAAGWAELYVYDRTDPEKRPFHHAYEAGQRRLWEQQVDVLLGITGAEEVKHAA